jgi:hypothetical protein
VLSSEMTHSPFYLFIVNFIHSHLFGLYVGKNETNVARIGKSVSIAICLYRKSVGQMLYRQNACRQNEMPPYLLLVKLIQLLYSVAFLKIYL